MPEESEFLLGVVHLVTPGPGVGQLPAPPRGPELPDAGVVEVDDRPLPVVEGVPSYWAYMRGEWVNLSDWVQSASWRHGAFSPNRIGEVMTPAEGFLMLEDGDGLFSVLNPNTHIDPHPGVPVEIRESFSRESALLFKGWSRGILNSGVKDPPYVSVMPIYGPMARLAEFGEGFSSRLDGQPTISDVFIRVLQEMEWTDLSIVYPSDLRVHGFRLNREGALGSGRRRARFLDLCSLLAILEGGRIYDNRLGAIYFESFNVRRETPLIVKSLTADDIQLFQTLETDSRVVNIIEGEADSFRSEGEQPLTFVGVSLPFDLIIPPQTEGWGVSWTIDREDFEFIESWAPLVRGTHYTWEIHHIDGLDAEPRFIGDERGCKIIFPNPTNEPVNASILLIEGEPFRKAFGQFLAERNGASIRRYGPKAVQYPLLTVVDQTAARARIQRWMKEYGGLREDGAAEPPLVIKVTLHEWRGAPWDVSDLVLVSYETLGKVHTNERPFWVEAVEHTINSEGEWDVILTLISTGPPGARVQEELLGRVVIRHGAILEELLGRVPVEVLLGRVMIAGPTDVIWFDHLLGRINVGPPEELLGRVMIPPQEAPEEELLGRVMVATGMEEEELLGRVTVAPPPVTEEFLLGRVVIPEVEVLLGKVPIPAAAVPQEQLLGRVTIPAQPVPQEQLLGRVTIPPPPTPLAPFILSWIVPGENQLFSAGDTLTFSVAYNGVQAGGTISATVYVAPSDAPHLTSLIGFTIDPQTTRIRGTLLVTGAFVFFDGTPRPWDLYIDATRNEDGANIITSRTFRVGS